MRIIIKSPFSPLLGTASPLSYLRNYLSKQLAFVARSRKQNSAGSCRRQTAASTTRRLGVLLDHCNVIPAAVHQPESKSLQAGCKTTSPLVKLVELRFTFHPTQNRSFWRRSSQPNLGLVLNKKLSYCRGTARRPCVLCFTKCGSQKTSKQQKWPSRSFKGIGNGVIRYTTYGFLLVFHCNYASTVYCTFSEILSRISLNLMRSRDPKHTHFSGITSCIHYSSFVSLKT